MQRVVLGRFPEFDKEIERLRAAGFDWWMILQLIIQYGPELKTILDTILELLTPKPKPVKAVIGCEDEEFDTLERALFEAVCAAHCARKKHCPV